MTHETPTHFNHSEAIKRLATLVGRLMGPQWQPCCRQGARVFMCGFHLKQQELAIKMTIHTFR